MISIQTPAHSVALTGAFMSESLHHRQAAFNGWLQHLRHAGICNGGYSWPGLVVFPCSSRRLAASQIRHPTYPRRRTLHASLSHNALELQLSLDTVSGSVSEVDKRRRRVVGDAPDKLVRLKWVRVLGRGNGAVNVSAGADRQPAPGRKGRDIGQRALCVDRHL